MKANLLITVLLILLAGNTVVDLKIGRDVPGYMVSQLPANLIATTLGIVAALFLDWSSFMAVISVTSVIFLLRNLMDSPHPLDSK